MGEKTHKGGSWLSTIKWLAIAFTMLLITLIAWKAYRVATAPVRAAQGGIQSVTETTKAVTDKTLNRLNVPVKRERSFSQLSEAAFETLQNIPVSAPAGISEKMFRATHLRGSDNKVCQMQLDFGDGPRPVYAAANNEQYATAKALGAKEGRVIRVHIITGKDDIALRSYWNNTDQNWAMRWRRATLTKPVSDGVARARLIDVLKAIPKDCSSD